MFTSLVAFSLVLTACGPAPAPQGTYTGSVEDGQGDIWECLVEIESTSPGRYHLHLDYSLTESGDEMTWIAYDGDGATILAEDQLQPDAGGELNFDLYSLEGLFYSALGEPYTVHVSRDDVSLLVRQ